MNPTYRRLRIRWMAMVAFATVSAALPARAANVIIVKSKNITSYNDAVTAFKVICKANFKGEYDMEGQPERGEKIAELVNSSKPDLVFAVGKDAALVAKDRIDADVPYLFTMVNEHEPLALKGERSSGVSLSIPAKQFLAAVKSIVPNTSKVGVVYNPKKSQAMMDEAFKAAQAQGIQFIAAKVETKEDTMRALRASFSAGIDALWMIRDPTVATEEAFLAMLDYSNANKIPFISFSDSMVEGGALASLSVSPESLGTQAGNLANRILGGTAAGSLPVEDPKRLELAINLDTAKRIGRECDIGMNIFTFAARNSYSIKVYGGNQ